MAWREVGNARTLLARNPKEPGMIATRFVFEKSLDAFRTGGAPPASARDARDVLEVIAACYHAAATGRRIVLDSGAPPELKSMRMGANPAA
jgi:predicted dehydrogenase